MKTIYRFSFLLILILLIQFLSFTSCKSRNERLPKADVGNNGAKDIHQQLRKIHKVVFFLENSESMFGYVSGFTEYVNVVSELAEKPQFVAQNIPREFFFINGGQKIFIDSLGKDPAFLKTKLNINGFNWGDITKSNLNSMFQIALGKAQNDTISILISDAIYDIGQPDSPMNALITEGRETRSKFITRLENVNLQTLLIKLMSSFDGYYFPSSKIGKKYINQERPFYIWIFGESDLLNAYFSEDYIYNLKGIKNYARFLVIEDEKAIPYQITPSMNRIGNFRPDHKNKYKMVKAKPKDGKFQFSIAVDFSSLPFSEAYLTDNKNFICSKPDYKVLKVERIKDYEKSRVTNISNPTHILTIFTDKNPYGFLEIVIDNKVPSWIKESDIENESQIDNDHTFGFKFLTDGISEAYSNKNVGKKLAKFNLEISN